MNTTILKLEHEIGSLISRDNLATVHFEHVSEEPEFGSSPQVTVSVFTVNPKSEETFLLRTESGQTREKAMLKILSYVRAQKERSPFTVLWSKNGGETHTSYFYCHDVKNVVDTFFHGKNVVDYVVYEIKLNPIA